MRYLVLVLLAAGLAGCAQNPTAPVPGPQSEVASGRAPVEISRSKVTTIARTVVTGLEATAAAYVLSANPPAVDRTTIARAEAVADNAVVRLINATDPALPSALITLSNAVSDFVQDLPPGRVPASVTAAVTALDTLIQTIAPLLRTQPIIPNTPMALPAIRIVG